MTNLSLSREFEKEVREKSRTARGVHSKKGINGYTGSIKFPSDFLKGQAKREYQGTGKVRCWNMYEKVITREEFDKLDQATQKAMMAKWRELYSNKEIIKGMKISTNTLSKYVEDLGLPRKARGVARAVSNLSPTVTPAPSFKAKENGLVVSFNKECSPEEIVSRLEKIGLLLDGEDSIFKIELKIIELEE